MSVSANTTVLGFSFNGESRLIAASEYFAVNTFVSSVVPVPLAGPLVAIGAIVFGLLWGMVLNVVSSTLGSYGTLLLTRSICRPCFLRLLGRRAAQWQTLDAAIMADGPMLALLIRCTPLFPLVVTNALLSLTSISHFNYCWTTLPHNFSDGQLYQAPMTRPVFAQIGLIPANLPYAYAAEVGVSLYEHFPPKDPVMLGLTLFGLLASIAIAYKVGRIAKRALSRHGLRGTPATRAPATATANAQDPSEFTPGLATSECQLVTSRGCRTTSIGNGAGAASLEFEMASSTALLKADAKVSDNGARNGNSQLAVRVSTNYKALRDVGTDHPAQLSSTGRLPLQEIVEPMASVEADEHSIHATDATAIGRALSTPDVVTHDACKNDQPSSSSYS